MTVFEGSRYRDAAVIRAKANDGKKRPTLYSMIATDPYRTSYQNYVTKEGDRFDLLANRLWGDPELWWRIANLNPEVFYPFDIPGGTVVRLPVR